MGLDISDLKLVVNVGEKSADNLIPFTFYDYLSGLPSDQWRIQQQAGRCGRDGSQAACVTVHWARQSGELFYSVLHNFLIGHSATTSTVRAVICGNRDHTGCVRSRLNNLFQIDHPYGE